MKPIDLMMLGGTAINRNAWDVIRPGEHYEPRNMKYGHLVFDAPPPPPGFQKKLNSEDFTGRKAGKLTVMFYWGRGRKDGGSQTQKWACRCVCGMYVIRTAKAIKDGNNPNDSCDHCRRFDLLKGRDRKRQVEYMHKKIASEKFAAIAAQKKGQP